MASPLTFIQRIKLYAEIAHRYAKAIYGGLAGIASTLATLTAFTTSLEQYGLRVLPELQQYLGWAAAGIGLLTAGTIAIVHNTAPERVEQILAYLRSIRDGSELPAEAITAGYSDADVDYILATQTAGAGRVEGPADEPPAPASTSVYLLPEGETDDKIEKGPEDN